MEIVGPDGKFIKNSDDQHSRSSEAIRKIKECITIANGGTWNSTCENVLSIKILQANVSAISEFIAKVLCTPEKCFKFNSMFVQELVQQAQQTELELEAFQKIMEMQKKKMMDEILQQKIEIEKATRNKNIRAKENDLEGQILIPEDQYKEIKASEIKNK